MDTEKKKKESLWFRLMEARRMFAQLPFLTTVVVLLLIYIFNVHLAERKIRQIHDMKQDVKELRWEYVSLHSELMHNTTQSQIAQRVAESGLKWGASRPILIGGKKNQE